MDLFNQPQDNTPQEQINPLNGFKTQAIQAHNNTSFDPEKRGEAMVKDYGNELVEDLEWLKANRATQEAINDYEERYKKYFSSYLNAKSRCFSVMITGAGNFPVRRHEKANRGQHKHYEIFREWRERAKKAIVRKAKEPKTYSSELERYKAELENLKVCHAKSKEGNKVISKAKKEGKDITEYLETEFKIVPHMIKWTMQFGFNTTNTLANIKRIEQRIKELEAKEAQRNEEPQKEYIFEGGKIVVNYEADRIQILHDSRPGAEVIALLKRNAFKWAPSNQAWQRQITANAMYATKQIHKQLKGE